MALPNLNCTSNLLNLRLIIFLKYSLGTFVGTSIKVTDIAPPICVKFFYLILNKFALKGVLGICLFKRWIDICDCNDFRFSVNLGVLHNVCYISYMISL